jgi:hypothetical protein
MLRNMTRARLIRTWFTAIALVIVAGVALGVTVTVGTGVIVLALCLVPPIIVLLLWPGIQPPTAAEVLRGIDGRS